MPRLSTVPKYRKHKQSGQAIVTLGGRDYLLGRHGTKASKLEYDRLIGEWLVNGRQMTVDSEQLTVVELCIRYLEFAKGYYVKGGKPTRVHNVKCAIKRVRELYGREPAVEFGPVALKVVRQRMIEQNCSRPYINGQVDEIRRMFKWAVAEQLIPPLVSHALAAVPGLRKGKSKARETSPITPIPDLAVALTLIYLPEVVADMVRLQRLTGMRPQDVCRLRPKDLERGGDVWTYRPESHKTEHHGKSRIICIGPQAQSVLLRYLARDSAMYCFRPCDSEQKRRAVAHAARITPMSCGNKPGTNRRRKPKRSAGESYDVAAYRRSIHRACDKAGIPRWSPNRLRHSTGTEIRRLYGLEAAQVMLGHSRADVTQVYAERDYALAARVAKEVG